MRQAEAVRSRLRFLENRFEVYTGGITELHALPEPPFRAYPYNNNNMRTTRVYALAISSRQSHCVVDTFTPAHTAEYLSTTHLSACLRALSPV